MRQVGMRNESMHAAMLRLLRLGLTREMRVVLVLVAATISLCSFAAGFFVGRLGTADGIDDECAMIRQESTRFMAEARGLDPDSAQHRIKARTSLYHVINNPGCFSAEDLATAQAALDELNVPRPGSTAK
ncbi:MAG: hypothetical protein DIU60_007700 [Actinomycetes bacterium]